MASFVGILAGLFATALMGGGGSSDNVLKSVFAGAFNKGKSGSQSGSVVSGPIAGPDGMGYYNYGDKFWDQNTDLTTAIKQFVTPGGDFGMGSDQMTKFEGYNLMAGAASDVIGMYERGRGRDLARDELAQRKDIAGWGPFGTKRGDKPFEGAPYELAAASTARGQQAPIATNVLGSISGAFPQGGLLSKKA